MLTRHASSRCVRSVIWFLFFLVRRLDPFKGLYDCNVSYNEFTIRSSFKANSSRITVTSATTAVENVWTITTTSLAIRPLLGTRSVVIRRLGSIRIILRVSPFWSGSGFSRQVFLFSMTNKLLLCGQTFCNMCKTD